MYADENTQFPPSTPSLPAGEPWNPLTLWAVSYWITVFASGVLLGLNWKRLGKPEWTTRTIIAAIIVPLLGLGYILGMLFFISNSLNNQIMLPLIMIGVGVIFGFVAALAYLQWGAYQKWKKHHDISGMLAHQYNFKRAAGVVILFIAAMIALAALIEST
jgi:hypothetical protein